MSCRSMCSNVSCCSCRQFISKMSNKNLTVVTAPDQKEAMENDAFKEEEYVAPEIDGTNVALDGRADANGFNDVYRAPNIIDGSRLTYWEGSQNEESQIISVDLKDSYTIHTVVVGLNPLRFGERELRHLQLKQVMTDRIIQK